MASINRFDKMGVMVDCSRNSVMTVLALKKLIDHLSAMGYNTLQLYTEDTLEIEGEPYFGYLRGRYTPAEIRELDDYAESKGIELIPCIQTLAHLQKLFRWQPYWGINDCNDILLVDEDRTYELIENLFKSVAKAFKSRRINIGMDEAFFLGRGEYLKKHGYRERGDIISAHLKKVAYIAQKHGFKCFMWGDMFLSRVTEGEGQRSYEVPENVELVYWDYYSLDKSHYGENLDKYKRICDRVNFAGGMWTWTGIVPHNGYSIQAAKASIEACIDHGVKEIFFTVWGDDGSYASPFSVLPALFTASEYARGNFDLVSIERRFEELFGIPIETFLLIDKPNILQEDDAKKTVNPAKYLMYNDCLLGMFDSTLTGRENGHFAACAKELSEAERYGAFEFVFKPIRLWCEALSIKADLGVRTRKLYKTCDKGGILSLIDSAYLPLRQKLRELYEQLKVYWNTLYKPHGFDVADLRFGAMDRRLEHVIEKLTAFSNGEIERIEELDEEIIDYLGKKENYTRGAISYNGFNTNATVNSI